MPSVSGWVTRGSRIVYANPWIEVREDEVVRPDGTDGIYGVVTQRNPAVFVVALGDDDEVVLVRLFRYTVGRDSWEVPAGGIDGDDPLVAAQRELREETGLAASDWTLIATMNGLNGIAVAREIVFLARGLFEVGGDEREDEGITEVVRVPWAEAMAMVRDGRIADAQTIACLLHAALHLGRL